jgi:DNA-binding MarR family transcriptional regulator
MSGFNINAIDDVIHGRIRLGIMAYLTGAERASFRDIAQALDTTDGNLSVHLRKLEAAGYLDIRKSFDGRKPLTEAALTSRGREAFAAYLDEMAKLSMQL